MYNLHVTSQKGSKIISYEGKKNLSQILIENDFFIDRPCSGKGTCGKCKVKFLTNAPEANSYDYKNLTNEEINQGYRLSCKCMVSYDAEIEVTEKSDIAVSETGIKNDNEIYYEDKNLLDSYGLAIDLGTTTIVVYLVSLSDGQVIDIESAINPQRKYGDNVITRCEYINSNSDGLHTLQNAVIEKINQLTYTLSSKNKIDLQKINRVVISGNTIMQHILIGVNPYQISIAPYTPVFTEQKNIKASNLGLNINPDANSFITNSISGYIGGDIVSGIIAAQMDVSDRTSILIDIGTNGEMVLKHKGKMYACSVAAGPAFEGEHIHFGVGGIIGAISKARLHEDKLVYETIGNANPVGICGSGLLDIVAHLVEQNVVDTTGSMDESKCRTVDNELVYYISDNIFVSQKDIREIQLAKSAIAAGVAVLIQKADINYSDIDTVFLAGGFGSYLNVHSAAVIGLFDKSLESKCKSAGNTAGMGSIKSLLSDNVLSSLNNLAKSVEYIELSLDKTFNDLFIDNMMF